MKLKSGLVMLALLGAALPAVPSQARNLSADLSVQPAATSEFSSAATRKKKKQVVVVDAPVRRVYGWRPADPSFDQNGRPYRPPAYLGDCVFDLGYGRFKSCHSDR